VLWASAEINGLGCFSEVQGKGFSRPVQFASNGIGGLLRELPDLLVTEFLVSDQEQEQAVLFREFFETLLDSLSKFLRFEHAQWIV
jgi:hypothetical protein